MDYAEWHMQVIRVASICGQNFLAALFEGQKEDNNCFTNLFELLDMEVKGTSESEKRKAMYFAIMAASYHVEVEQEKLVQSLIKK